MSEFKIIIPHGVRSWFIQYSEATGNFRVSLNVAYDVLSIRGSSLAYLSGHGVASGLQVAIDNAAREIQAAIAQENERLAQVVDAPARAPKETADDLLAMLGLD